MKKTSASERGSALVIVVGVVAVLTVMVLHITVASGIVAREAAVSAARVHLRYEAESAAEQTFWLYLSDRRRYPSRSIQPAAPADLGFESDAERWQADGTERVVVVDGSTVSVRLFDADRGLDVTGANPAEAIRSLATSEQNLDPDLSEVMKHLSDQIADYIDGGDDFRRLQGMERDEYSALGWPDLPRNAALQFREEMLWLEALPEAMALLGFTAPAELIHALRLIPPRGMSFPANQNPNFFAASDLLLRSKLDLSDTEIDAVIDARARWQAGEADALSDLPPDILARIRGQFSFNESGIVTILATASHANGEIKRTFKTTRDSRQIPPANAPIPFWTTWESIVDPTP